jgi:hypothetical protein
MPRRPGRPPTLLEAAQEDIDLQWRLKADALLSWDTRLAHKAKRWTRLVGAITGLLVAGGTAAVTVKGYAVKLWRVIHRGTLPPASVAVHNPDVASTTVDRVPELKPPGR